MKTLVLKNGSEEAEPLVKVTMMSLRNLMETNLIAFYELVCLCRDGKHQLFGNTGEVLGKFSLVSNGQVHDSIRNIVLSAAEGEGLDMRLTNPVVA